MVRKCSVGGCKTNYASQQGDGPSEPTTIYGFPTSSDERAKWLASLPNKIDPDRVTKNMGVCAKHFPKDVPMVRRGRYMVPNAQPSIFFNVPALCIPTPSCPSRSTTKSSSDSRAKTMDVDEMAQFRELDTLCNLKDFPTSFQSRHPQYGVTTYCEGRPHANPTHPDYVPNKNLGYSAKKNGTSQRCENLKKKDEQKQKAEEEKRVKEAADILLRIQENIPKHMDKGTQTYNDVTQTVHIMKAQVRTLEKEIDIVHHLNSKLLSQVERLKEEVNILKSIGGQQPAHIKVELDEVLKSGLPSYTGEFMETVTVHMNGEVQESAESTSKAYDLKLHSQAQELNEIVKMDDYTSCQPSTDDSDQTGISKFYPNLKSHLMHPNL